MMSAGLHSAPLPAVSPASWAAALTLHLPAARTAPAIARHAVGAVLAQWGHSEDVALVVSELVTNSVEYGAPPIVLRVLRREGRVHISVFDSSPVPPCWRTPRLDEEGGRGLLVVAAVATTYGYRRTGAGKATWATLSVP
ncbi:ATP-binding protein [Streptomyces sp. NPDC101151]|uniref:ATP-binding protein n=1 Tax=Streptomyces sp. NPDC101151 TaxID=3366115 RepID=UPI0037F51429